VQKLMKTDDVSFSMPQSIHPPSPTSASLVILLSVAAHHLPASALKDWMLRFRRGQETKQLGPTD
jgi:hypothetical protein